MSVSFSGETLELNGRPPDFEWNGVDISQFGPVANTTGSGGVLSVQTVASAYPSQVNNTKYTNVLRLTNPDLDDGSRALIAVELPFVGTLRNLRIEWVGAGLGLAFGGFAVMADYNSSNEVFSYERTLGISTSNGSMARIDGPAFVPGILASQLWDGAFGVRGVTEVYGGKAVGGPPQFGVRNEIFGGDNEVDIIEHNVRSDFPGGAPPASWDPLRCKRFGLAVHGRPGVASGTIDLLALRAWVI